MLSTLHRRVGDENRPMETSLADGTDIGTSGWGGTNRRAWGRVLGGSIDIQQDGIAGVDSHSTMAGLQTGVDLYGDSRWHAGLYIGALHTRSRVSGHVGGSFGAAGQLRLDDHYFGGYGTYTDASGLYTDMVLQYGLHDVSTTAPRTSTNARGTSLTASIEAGQSFALGHGWAIEPQAQLIFNQLSLGSANIPGATIQQDADKQLTGRLGMRFTGDMATAAGRLQPYGRVDVWHGFSGADTTRFISAATTTSIGTRVGYTSTELALGFTLQLTPVVSVYGEVGRLFKVSGGESRLRSAVQGSAGLKINF